MFSLKGKTEEEELCVRRMCREVADAAAEAAVEE
jgi:hypothetical protein